VQYEGAAAQVLGTAKLELLDDARLPPLADSGVISGGTAILKSQSACPFQAQARYRLLARSLESPHPGMDRRTSGMIIHEALDQLWRRWRNRDGLINAEHWRQQVSDAVGQAIRRLRLGDRKNRSAMLEIEHGRLCRLISALIEQEREREDFEIIDSEKSVEIDLPGLTLRTRSDRLDRTASGATLIIDYKSGLARVADWLGERPVDPQLLIYAVGSKAPVDGLAFAILKAGQIGYRGISTAPGEIPGVKSIDATRGLPEGVAEWDDLVDYWRKAVHGLAGEFTAGHAAVAPRDQSVCRYCDLTALCRRADLAYDARSR
jgi:ATP-dependent helicase/DNAse subunit B